MKKWGERVGCLVLILALFLVMRVWSDPATHRLPDMQRHLQVWLGDAFGPFMVSGCYPSVPGASLTFGAFSCEGYVKDSTTGELLWVGQSSVTVGPLNSGNGTYCLALHKDRTTAVTGWTRQTGTHYFWRQIACASASAVSGLEPFAQVTVAGGVITAVSDYAWRAAWASKIREVNVMDYGLVCDNSTDTTAAFTRAISVAELRGKLPVKFPAQGSDTSKKCKITGVGLVSYVNFQGGGRTSSVLSCVNAGTQSGLLRRSDLTGAQEFTISDVGVSDCLYGYDGRGLNYVHLVNNRFMTNDTGMILGQRSVSESGSIWNLYEHNRFDSTTRDLDIDITVSGTAVNHNNFWANSFESNTNPLRWRGSGGNGLAQVNFLGNNLEGGLLVDVATGGTLLGNYFEGGSPHVDLKNTNGWAALGNYHQLGSAAGPAYRLGASSATFAGVKIGANSIFGNGTQTGELVDASASASSGACIVGANYHNNMSATFTDTLGRCAEITTSSTELELYSRNEVQAIINGNVRFGVESGGADAGDGGLFRLHTGAVAFAGATAPTLPTSGIACTDCPGTAAGNSWLRVTLPDGSTGWALIWK